MSVKSCLVLSILATLCFAAESTYIKDSCDGKIIYKYCKTWTNKRVTCKVDEGTVTSVDLLKDVSGGYCNDKNSWGYDQTSIWVEDCCMARFKVCVTEDRKCDFEKKYSKCESWKYKYAKCEYKDGIIKKAQVEERYSDAKCVENESWGYKEDYIWVKAGCRAKFWMCIENRKCDFIKEYKKCESWKYKYAKCEYKDGIIKNVQVEERYSDAKCVENESWGYKNDYIWVKAGCRAKFWMCVENRKCDFEKEYKKCESWKYKYAKCEYKDGIIKKVQVEERYSDAKCVENESWGYKEDYIWVKAGCRAKFWMCVENRKCDFIKEYKKCESWKYKYAKCEYKDGIIKNVQVEERYSDAKCVENESWGYKNDYIWVKAGCRAKFWMCVEKDRKCDFEKEFSKCESWKYKYAKYEYKDGIIKNVQVEERYSDAKCVENESWGYKEDYIWVKAGCRAKFWMCVEKDRKCDFGKEFKKCESWKYKYAKCEYKDGIIKKVQVEERYSDAKCVENESWGYKNDYIWVKAGCRAKFWMCVENQILYLHKMLEGKKKCLFFYCSTSRNNYSGDSSNNRSFAIPGRDR